MYLDPLARASISANQMILLVFEDQAMYTELEPQKGPTWTKFKKVMKIFDSFL